MSINSIRHGWSQPPLIPPPTGRLKLTLSYSGPTSQCVVTVSQYLGDSADLTACETVGFDLDDAGYAALGLYLGEWHADTHRKLSPF